MKKQVILVADLGFGDAGKGTIVDYLARTEPVHTVIRYNGGAQAAHNVVERSGRYHRFSQFGSGTLIPAVKTFLSRFMLLNPISLLREGEELQEKGVPQVFERITVDQKALVTTPFQIAVNRLKEIARGDGRHGSCGMGIGETMIDWLAHGENTLFAGDLLQEKVLRQKLLFLQKIKWEEVSTGIARDLAGNQLAQREIDLLTDPTAVDFIIHCYQDFANRVSVVDGKEAMERTLEKKGTVVFEGAQGVLIDEWYGFHPYTTWSTTTFKNALTILAEAGYQDSLIRLGLLRAYTTRHGPGPFVTENRELTEKFPDVHNENNQWQREFRVGWFDLVAAKYAVELVGGVDFLAITNLDRFYDFPHWRFCNTYQCPGPEVELRKFFDLTPQGKICGIKIKRDLEDLDFQEQITNWLFRCEPRYLEIFRKKTKAGIIPGVVPKDIAEYLSFIEQQTGIPVGIASQGPTAEDKVDLGLANRISGKIVGIADYLTQRRVG